jgi:(E)-4-hydroxy-3-methylbut-2-enyl-diphosphate synthase
MEQGPASAALGADQPLRVELDLGLARQGADALFARIDALASGDRPLEVAQVRVEDHADLAQLEELASLLDAHNSPVGLAVWAAPSVWSAHRDALLASAARLTPAGVDAAQVADLAKAVAAVEDMSLLFEGSQSQPRLELARHLRELVQGAKTAGLDRVAVAIAPDAARGPVTPWVRSLANELDAAGLEAPIVLIGASTREGGFLEPATDVGGLLIDGLGDGLRLAGFEPERALDVSYRILQGSRRRTTRTEYISCPGCGRTLFELEPVTAQIKERTDHLKGVKIAVMGCIVNGPGEMADADFGYVGWKPGKVNLYVGRECVVREVPEAEAPDRLVDLIKEHGRWTEPVAAT